MGDTVAVQPTSRIGPSQKRDAVGIGGVAALLSLLLWKPWSGVLEMLVTFLMLMVLSALIYVCSGALARAERVATKAAGSNLAIWLVAITGFVLPASLSLLTQLPQPRASDEFSNLLAADTFAHGRLTNPTHPMWRHFETFHVLQTPSYMSKFPPALGLILALGELLGNPAIGVWLSSALACAATFWMLKQWLPGRWALLGAIIAALHPQMLEWSHNYFGGQMAMAGGALAIGGLRRLMTGPGARDGVLTGLGIALLANTRPYDGLVLAIALVLVWLIWIRRARQLTLGRSFARFVATASLVVLLSGIAMGLYNYRITGNPVKMPYMAYEATYDPVPLFWWSKPRPIPAYNNAEFQNMYVVTQLQSFNSLRSLAGFWKLTRIKMESYLNAFLLGFGALSLLVVMSIWWRGARLSRLVAGALVVFCAGQLPEVFSGTRYFGPAVSLCMLLALLVLRRWRVCRWRNFRFGLLMTRALVIVVFLYFANSFGFAIQDLRANGADWEYQRAALIGRLSQDRGRNLVFVRYLQNYDVNVEWVYNGANIDESAVVWARDLGEAENQELLDYYKDRRAWLLTVGPGHDWRLTAAPGQAGDASAVTSSTLTDRLDSVGGN